MTFAANRPVLRRAVTIAVGAPALVAGLLAAPWTAPSAFAAAGDAVAVVVAEIPNGGIGAVGSYDISADGRYVALEWQDHSKPSVQDVYVVDLQTDEATKLSVGLQGTAANGRSGQPTMSDDGWYVAFHSSADNLVAGDTNNVNDVFRVARQTGETIRVSVGADGTQSTQDSYSAQISGDGESVAFQSGSADLVAGDTNDQADVFLKDLATDDLTRVSNAVDGTAAGGFAPTISSDGRVVGFVGWQNNIVAGDTNNTNDVFVADLGTLTMTRASAGSQPVGTDLGGTTPAVSGNGRYVGFTSDSTNLVPSDTNGTLDVFVRDLSTGATRLASGAEDGSSADGWSAGSSLSHDGRFVAFHSTATNLVPVAGLGGTRTDVYVRDMVTGTTSLGLQGFDGQPPNGQSEFPRISYDGRYVVSYSWATNIVSGEQAYGRLYRYDRGESDETGPLVSLQDGPPNPTSDNSPTLAFSAEPGTTFECSLSSGPAVFDPCESPISYPQQPNGPITWQVRGTDSVGNVGPLTSYTFTIEAAAPTVSIDSAPEPVSADTTPTVSFSSEAQATFECSVSRDVDAYSPCASPATFGPLEDGDYTFKVKASDAAGNTSAPSTVDFTIETTVVTVAAPSTPDLTTSSDTGLSTTDNVTRDTTPTFAGTAEAGTAVGIHVDGVPRGSATVSGTGTYSVTTNVLPVGGHQITAVATDPSGNTSQASAALTVEIVPATACHTATNRINGTAANNTLNGARLADLMFGLGGNDIMDGRANGDCLLGGTGSDELSGAAGNDDLLGEDGNDKLVLGGGTDAAAGGTGTDRIFARDGTADRIDCGAGTADIATIDGLDVVVNCETVRLG